MQKEDLSKLGFEEKREGQEEAKEDKTRYVGNELDKAFQKRKMLIPTPSLVVF